MTLKSGIPCCGVGIEGRTAGCGIFVIHNWRPEVAHHSPLTTHHSPLTPSRGGWSLLELMVVLTITGILTAMSVPSFSRALEQSRADVAGANLRAIWAAERLYWLEYRTYAATLADLQSLGLLDPTLASATTVYVYAIQSAGSNTFTATATRTGSGRWSGEFAIDAAGTLSGVVQATGEPDIVPGFQ
ncbi:MAG: prepilin-type N-terminal cleavage/methylation domain-containing protein [Planctomycetes bacterium]|nr:prepilin-type N-terminal cleavage/methylation domain-containing protein [Planctomycetota bacterium]